MGFSDLIRTAVGGQMQAGWIGEGADPIPSHAGEVLKTVAEIADRRKTGERLDQLFAQSEHGWGAAAWLAGLAYGSVAGTVSGCNDLADTLIHMPKAMIVGTGDFVVNAAHGRFPDPKKAIITIGDTIGSMIQKPVMALADMFVYGKPASGSVALFESGVNALPVAVAGAGFVSMGKWSVNRFVGAAKSIGTKMAGDGFVGPTMAMAGAGVWASGMQEAALATVGHGGWGALPVWSMPTQSQMSGDDAVGGANDNDSIVVATTEELKAALQRLHIVHRTFAKLIGEPYSKVNTWLAHGKIPDAYLDKINKWFRDVHDYVVKDASDLKETLRTRGVRQERLAKALGVEQSTVSKWFERGSLPSEYTQKINRFLRGQPVGPVNVKMTADVVGKNWLLGLLPEEIRDIIVSIVPVANKRGRYVATTQGGGVYSLSIEVKATKVELPE